MRAYYYSITVQLSFFFYVFVFPTEEGFYLSCHIKKVGKHAGLSKMFMLYLCSARNLLISYENSRYYLPIVIKSKCCVDSNYEERRYSGVKIQFLF